jgi:uncharacterized LabA/DUF88 family protein
MTKVAVQIDGGFFLKRLRGVRPDVDPMDPQAVQKALLQLVNSHLCQVHATHMAKTPQELLYRVFYYDAMPYQRRIHTPIGKRFIKFGETPQAQFRTELFDLLRRSPNVAVRLGETVTERDWLLSDKSQSDLLNGKRVWADLTDDDFVPGIRQKAVDMRLGLDIASITLKRQADMIVLVTGDSDFVPAAKLARREGVRVILDPLWQSVRPELFEHIDLLRSGFPKPTKAVSS